MHAVTAVWRGMTFAMRRAISLSYHTLIIYSVSLVKLGAKTPEELTDGEIFYDLDRYPKIGMTADREKRGSHNGYLTMVNWFVTFKNMCPTNIF